MANRIDDSNTAARKSDKYILLKFTNNIRDEILGNLLKEFANINACDPKDNERCQDDECEIDEFYEGAHCCK